MTEQFDVVIIGSGAGGGTMAHALAGSGARILILERGDFVPQEAENWDPAAVWKDLGISPLSAGSTTAAANSVPTHYNVGGNTKFWGSVLYRLRREDFRAMEHRDGLSPAWPIDYDTLAPYCDRAERLQGARSAWHRSDRARPRPYYPARPWITPAMAAIVEELRAQGLHPSRSARPAPPRRT